MKEHIMFLLRSALCSLLILSAISVSTHAQDQRLRDLAKFHGREHAGQPMFMVGPTVDYERKTIAELTKEAELVIQGRLVKLQSNFGRAGDRVLTDYAIQNPRVLAGRSTSVVAQAQTSPGPLILTLLGGEVTIDGVLVRYFPSDHLTVVDGGEYFMFLVPSLAGERRYQPYNGGIFKIDVGLIRPVIQAGDVIFKDAFDSPMPLVIGQIETAAIARPAKYGNK